ncbi:MAG: nucleotidyltransferase domain-containing protein [Deltaproteobacteria bacterium]|nr:nucleotidyltransferase domain-containing protein [Deltaproteobacteria bacterium]
MIKETLQKSRRLSRLLRQEPLIDLAYLFGSHSKHPTRNPRDIDIALMLKAPLRGMHKIRFMTRIGTAIEHVIVHELGKHQPVDVVLLNEADPLLAHQVLKYGTLLFARRKKMARDFTVQTMTRYFDAKPLHDFFFQRAKEAFHGR